MSTDPIVPLDIVKGPKRSFLKTEPSGLLKDLRTSRSILEKILLVTLGIITIIVRAHGLSYPDSVVFDEVHFGGFASEYIKGTFFMDVHPPLAKMLYAGVASLAGFDGSFAFEAIGDKFTTSTPYVVMRLFSATLGSVTVFLLYFTLRLSGVRVWVAFLTALGFVVENSFVTISRYILLDSPLIFFIALVVYSFKKYEIFQTDSLLSYKALLSTGIALGFATSSKWVGLFTLAWVGLLCIWRLWFMIGDLTKSVSQILRVAIAKLLFLLVVPFILYCAFFQIHFHALRLDSDGSSFFSPQFRTTLQGNSIPSDIQAEVGVTSKVTLRHLNTMGGYLHSHSHLYPAGSQQQQVTLYPHLDQNNDWIIESNLLSGFSTSKFVNITDNSVIRLFHESTHCRLHSHDHKAPVSEGSDWQKEVSCYGYTGFEGDANDDWVVEIDQDASKPGIAQKQVIAIDTKFRLRHASSKCYLFSHEVKLPDWGFEQQEVTCASSGKAHLSLWYVENNEHPLLNETSVHVSYEKPGFWAKFVESHEKMWNINKNLVESHIYESLPKDWPFLLRGISYWGEENRAVYLLGNAIMWWSVSAFIVLFVAIVFVELISWQLGYGSFIQEKHIFNFHVQVIHYLLGFAVHYAPSFLMKRQMFLHHYLPAYYFGILALGHALDIVVSYVFKKRRYVGYSIVVIFIVGCAVFFNQFKPLIYASKWTNSECTKSQWLVNWDYNCATFPDSISDYPSLDANRIRGAMATPTATKDEDAGVIEELNEENVNQLL
ncbi:hypothetical protein KAFR_0K02400 [Kazachstania africana CBS 2517]|uniref:Dolichyl-phosphate-mannose--protein mannosyltransferase n=1 Tax=Kazachstania africana (strain ATCC 22294 / BCRC 22015 / CBS 2517 / CECT 1963 / NBRC 1671 / NRRL Y-8276) TaxID=1071382 RepID=H2B1U6_KAZAF|nr:hypothetical protein KAFR_0K02400 [Kazachstania africana CBS 2517]CCF60596.1 hypothetical protein KAFR_0K02400 [Kazachstania africana CBS 2517]